MLPSILKRQPKVLGQRHLADTRLMLTDFGLVVIGAHSGIYLKDLFEEYSNKKILLVEPVPYNFEILQNKYSKKKNFYLSNNAVLDTNKEQDFFYIKKNSISKLGKHWATGIGSFDKNHILNHKGKRFKVTEEDIQKEKVEFLTFKNLLKKFSIKSIENLRLDVEGAEYLILNSIDFSEIEINQIFFESKHFDGTFTEGQNLKKMKEKLILNGYSLKQVDKENILAVKKIN